MNLCFLAFRVFICLLTLGGLASAADIFVYKGTLRFRGGLSVANQFPPLVRTYVVINFDTGEARGILYFNKGGRKQLISDSPFNVTRATLPNAKIATVISYGDHSHTSLTNFNTSAVLIQGPDVSLKIETQPVPRIVPRPRVLIGSGLVANSQTGSDGFFEFINYNLVLQPVLTIDANDNDKTINTVIDEVSAKLVAQGYQVP